MPGFEIHDITPDDEYFVTTCGHINEDAEFDRGAAARLGWFSENYSKGFRAKVVTIDGEQVGAAFLVPIEINPWGPVGHDLMVMNCLFVQEAALNKGIGKALIEAAVNEAKEQGRKGLVTFGYFHDYPFMQAAYFEKVGFEMVARKGDEALYWMPFDESAEPPKFLERKYEYVPVEGKVVIDLFWHSFCLTVNMERHNVMEVAGEYGDRVVLNEYCTNDPGILAKYQVPRAIYVNGKEIYWGYAAPKEGIREAIDKQLE
jgi:GNAT superfamily N-acetyltransferase